MQATWRIMNFNALALGTAANQRIGMNTRVMSIEVRMSFFQNAATTIGQNLRFTCVVDRQCNGVLPAGADIFSIDSIYGLRNLANRKRFKTLFDQTCFIGGYASGYDGPGAVYKHIYYKIRRGLKVEYNTGNAATIADISSNSLLFCTVGSTVTGPTNAITNYVIRTRFLDY